MQNLCETCVTKLENRYDKTTCPTVLRKYGIPSMIAFRCGLEFDDMLDTVASTGEWATHITAKNIILFPRDGKLEIGGQTSESFETGCGKQIPFGTNAPWTFTTPSSDPDGLDEDWWYALHNDFYGWKYGWIDCNGKLYVDDTSISLLKAAIEESDPAVVVQPGFDFMLSEIPMFEQVNGPGKPGQWRATGTFQFDRVLRGVEIPGLLELLNATL